MNRHEREETGTGTPASGRAPARSPGAWLRALDRLAPERWTRPLRRVGFYASAVAAAFVAAFLLVNYVIMPLMVKRGDLVRAPAVVGRSLIEARAAAEEAGLRIRVEMERPDPVAPAGSIIEQMPAAGTSIKCGRTLLVVTSSGLDLREIPRLAGMPARQAQLEAESAGFAVSEIVEVHSPTVERGDVVGSDPGAGAVHPAGTGIRLVVSLGPKPLELVMPSLVGKTPEEARVIAEGLGLVVRTSRYGSGRSSALRDVVILQEPPAGTRVLEGDEVRLRIGKG